MHAINEVSNEWSQLMEPISGDHGFSAAFRRHIGFVRICVVLSFSAAFRWLFGVTYFRWFELFGIQLVI